MKSRKIIINSIFIFIATTSYAGAQEIQPIAAQATQGTVEFLEAVRSVEETAAQVEETQKEIQKTIEQGKGLSFFGAGPAVTLNLANRDRVNEAMLDENNIIRLSKQSDASVGIFLEAHYLWPTKHLLPFGLLRCPGARGSGKELKFQSTTCGFGPFVGVQPGGSSEIIEGIGAGVMWGFKGSGDNIFNSTQFNVGVGVFVDPTVQTLGAGQFQDQPLPTGETMIRFQEDFQANFMIIFTVNPF